MRLIWFEFPTAITVRYLTRRFIGEYSSSGGEEIFEEINGAWGGGRGGLHLIVLIGSSSTSPTIHFRLSLFAQCYLWECYDRYWDSRHLQLHGKLYLSGLCPFNIQQSEAEHLRATCVDLPTHCPLVKQNTFTDTHFIQFSIERKSHKLPIPFTLRNLLIKIEINFAAKHVWKRDKYVS